MKRSIPSPAMRRRTPRVLLTLAAVLAGAAACLHGGRSAPAAEPGRVEWTWRWQARPAEPAPAAELSPFRFGKQWAYSVEIDDGPVSTLTVAQPLLAKYAFTDAPPGVKGGRPQPFVGGAAVIVMRTGTGTDAFLSWDQLRELRARGWSVLNHGYWHAGNGWDPKAALNADQLRSELFWSQAVAEAELGRAPSHLPYPNGYTAYEPYLAEFGLRSASRVSGTSGVNTRGPGFKPLDLNRNYLDEGVWAPANNPLTGLPAAPRSGDFIIDFTHGINADPQSPNHRRWAERLRHLADAFGAGGEDTVWCAPTDEVVEYAQARNAAEVRAGQGAVTVSVPRPLAGASLTLHLSGIAPETPLTAPAGGRLYRSGDQVWVTTPALAPRPELPGPRVRRIYRGPVRNVELDRPEKIAGVRLLQHGKPAPGYTLSITLSGGAREETLARTQPGENWASWTLYTAFPNRVPPLARSVRVSPDPAFKEMEIWAAD